MRKRQYQDALKTLRQQQREPKEKEASRGSDEALRAEIHAIRALFSQEVEQLRERIGSLEERIEELERGQFPEWEPDLEPDWK
jgi:ubiquinone biosynthesis protein UbiJ